MSDCWTIWRGAARQPQVDAALRELYHQLEYELATKQVSCEQSGRCCKFDTFGHRLYVTGLEIAWFLENVEPPTLPQDDGALPVLVERDGCPYQIDHLCTAHTVRPLGCRVFFCQSGSEAWQQEIYEQYLSKLKTLHDQFELPYQYLEWRAGLEEGLTV